MTWKRQRRASAAGARESVKENRGGHLNSPARFPAVAQISGAGRWATLTLLPYFVLGAWLLLKVDLERGAKHAQESAEV